MLIREVMSSPAVTVPHTATIRQAVRVLCEHGITASPVVDGDGRLVGIVSEMDLLKGAFEADPRAFARPATEPEIPTPHHVTQVMTEQVRTAGETGDVAELAEMMITTGIKSVPVVRGGKLVGMVSRSDLMGMLAHSDARVRDDVQAALKSVFPGGTGWDVAVVDGDVRLSGPAGPQAERIVEVIAKTVPGVSRVIILDRPARPEIEG